jgi:Uma2 family endonuclease
MGIKPLKKDATYDDLCDVADNYVAELFDGELYATPRPMPRHTHAASVLGIKIGAPFHRRGPGGWIILDEPELHLRDDVLVPDIAGWRRERLPELAAEAYVTLAPDWICEVLSPSTEAIDRGKKLAIYAREGVSHVWLVNPVQQTLEVLVLDRGRWASMRTHEGSANARVPPFDAIELELGALWI